MNAVLRGPVDVLIFDLFGVLIEFDNDIVYRRLARHCRDEEDAFVRLNGVMADDDIITGRLSLPELHAQLAATLGLTLTYDAFLAAWNEPYSRALPGMADLLQRLAARHRLLLLSNVDSHYWNAIRPLHPELSYFESLLVSCDLGLCKPQIEIFQQAARVAGVTPDRCLFIDDTARNVDAASTMGFQTHLFTSVENLRNELLTRGLPDI